MGKYDCCGMVGSMMEVNEKKASARLTAPEADAAEGNQPVQRWSC